MLTGKRQKEDKKEKGKRLIKPPYSANVLLVLLSQFPLEQLLEFPSRCCMFLSICFRDCSD